MLSGYAGEWLKYSIFRFHTDTSQMYSDPLNMYIFLYLQCNMLTDAGQIVICNSGNQHYPSVSLDDHYIQMGKNNLMNRKILSTNRNILIAILARRHTGS